MFTLRIEYLTGRSVSTAYNNRTDGEWPPHPARVYSALVRAWSDAEGGCDEEARALDWLASAGAPSIYASPANHRRVVPHFVPVNDVTVIGAQRDRGYAALAEAEDAERALEGADPRDRQARARALTRAQRRLDTARSRLRAELNERVGPEDKPPKDAVRKAAATLPEGRTRQQRYFPSVAPEDPVVYMVWPETPADAERGALGTLAARVGSIGHSSSLVCCRVCDPPERPADWTPMPRESDNGGGQRLRVPLPDQLDRLRAAFDEHRGMEPRVLPFTARRYRPKGTGIVRASRAASVFGDDWIVLRRVGGPIFSITAVADVASALRGAMLAFAEDPTLEVLSGHDAEGRPSELPHVAYVPLPFVGREHATGAVLGVAVVLPEAIDDAARTAILRAVGRWEAEHRHEDEEAPTVPIRMGRSGVLEVERVAWGEPPLSTLRPRTWCGPSLRWISATPVALDRNPGDLFSSDPARAEAAFAEAAESVANACVNIGLPRPETVTIVPSATLPGTAKARDYPPYPRNRDRTRRVKVHAQLAFAEPVRGPVLLGAGRYFGLGLFRPLRPSGGRS